MVGIHNWQLGLFPERAQRDVWAKDTGILISSSYAPTGQIADTGISQIWLGSLLGVKPTRLTSGAGPSFNPALSDDGGLLAFESTADLAGSGADTGVSQIFIFDPKSKDFARITNDAGGCHLPGVSSVHKDFRVTFVCSGEPCFCMVAADLRFHVNVGGVTQRILGEMGSISSWSAARVIRLLGHHANKPGVLDQPLQAPGSTGPRPRHLVPGPRHSAQSSRLCTRRVLSSRRWRV